LSVGPGAEEWHLVAAALYGASVTVVQPDAYQPLTHGLLPTDQRTRLFEKIESAHESAVELLGEDRVNNKIDVQTYRGYVQDVNLPQDNYSHVFLLNVIAVIQGGSEMEFFTAVFDSLKDNAVILISELLEKEEDDFETLNRWGDRLGYNVELEERFYSDQTILKVRVQRKNTLISMPAITSA